MKSDSHYREPRSAVIFRHTKDAVRNSPHNDASLAQAIAEQYMADVAPGERIVMFYAGTDAASVERAMKNNAQLIARIRCGKVKMPVDLEESWVRALPQEQSEACAQELARRYGFTGARVPGMDVAAGVNCVASLAVEFGQTVAAVTAVHADGAVCANDLPNLRKGRAELEQLLAQVQTLTAYVDAHIERLTGPRAVAAGGTA